MKKFYYFILLLFISNFCFSQTIPTVVTIPVTNITNTTATSGGNITSDGGAFVFAKGVCWSTNSSPTVSDAHTSNGSVAVSYVSNLTSLLSGTTYCVKAYAINSAGTAYGDCETFTTTGTVGLNSVSSNKADIISIYPNPSNGIFNVDFELFNYEKISLNLYNNINQQVLYEKMNNFSGSKKREINIKNLPKGIYYLKIQAEEVIFSKKVVIF